MDLETLAAAPTANPNLEMVREFQAAFGFINQPEPWMPDLSREDRWVVADISEMLGKMSKRLKATVARANATGRKDLATLLVRLQMHVEEGGELAEAWVKGDLVEVLDALTDISYVTDGTYLTHGLDRLKDPAFTEVHRSNMSKLDLDGQPIINESGRVVKPPHYSPPDLAPLLRK